MRDWKARDAYLECRKAHEGVPPMRERLHWLQTWTNSTGRGRCVPSAKCGRACTRSSLTSEYCMRSQHREASSPKGDLRIDSSLCIRVRAGLCGRQGCGRSGAHDRSRQRNRTHLRYRIRQPHIANFRLSGKVVIVTSGVPHLPAEIIITLGTFRPPISPFPRKRYRQARRTGSLYGVVLRCTRDPRPD